MKKMHKLKKVLTMMLAFALLFATGTVNVNAEKATAEKTTGTLTLQTGQAGNKENSVFSAYKILDATLPEGQDVYEFSYNESFKTFAEENPEFSVDKIADMISGPTDANVNTATVDKLASALENFIQKNTVAADQADIKVGTATALEIGYYLVLETTPTEGTKETKPILVAIPEEVATADYNYAVTVTLKDQKITTTKTIEESNAAQQDSIAQQVGKEVTFKVVQDVPKYDATYKDVVFKVNDTMSKGLTFGKLLSVKAGETALSEGQYGFTKKVEEDGTTSLVFDFSDITGGTDYYQYVKNASEVTITYTATLNKDASFTTIGNTNEVYPTYTNGPGMTTDGDKDITVQYAGVMELTKKDKDDAKKLLKDAEFTVYTDEACQTEAKLVTYTMDSEGVITEVPNTELSATVKTDKNGVARVAGLGAGTYYIKETNAPGGYILLKNPIKVTVDVKLPDQIVTGQETAVFTYTVEGNGTANIQNDNGKITFDVQNAKGFSLPTTGGMGTYLFIIGGGIMILAAVVLMVRSRRKAQ